MAAVRRRIRVPRPFKNRLCLALIPEAHWSERWVGLSYRHQRCQRLQNHAGPHRSWSRQWNDESTVSVFRGKT